MYRLLLVSDKPEIRDLYAGFPEWEKLGFEQPTVAENAQRGIEKLNERRYDAVSWLLSISEGKRFFEVLSHRPEMLGMETARDEARLRREISSARRQLSSRDAARQTKQIDDLTRTLQTEFLYDLLRGTPFSKEAIDERALSLKLKTVNVARPVATSSLRLPQGDYFLAEVWRYGRERMENALKNIFESPDEGMIYRLLIINPHHMRLIGLPTWDMQAEEVYARMLTHLDRCQKSLEQYFELTLNIKRVVSYTSLYALSEENAVRTAH